MSWSAWRAGALGAVLVAVAMACNGPPPKQANDVDENPPSTSGTSHASSGGGGSDYDDSTHVVPASTGGGTSAGGAGGAAADDSPLPMKAGMGYDRDATKAELRRASQQAANNCGKMKETDGGPAPNGQTSVQLVLGHGGHVKDVKTDMTYEGSIAGSCIVNAFKKVTFPPWDGDDISISLQLDVKAPGAK